MVRLQTQAGFALRLRLKTKSGLGLSSIASETSNKSQPNLITFFGYWLHRERFVVTRARPARNDLSIQHRFDIVPVDSFSISIKARSFR